MRWIVATLIIFNLLVFGWFMLFAEQPATPLPGAGAPEMGGDNIRLLSELDTQDRQQTASQPPVPLPETAPGGDGPLCTLVGPFPKLLRAEYFAERLAALDLTASIQEVEVPGEAGYWVYLAPLDSRRQAFNKLQELQAKGIDSYVIPRGELENGISFGMFSQKTLAEQRLEDMKSKGYAAELQEVARTYREIWVNLPPGQASRLEMETWQEMLAGEEGAELRQNYCPPVASN